MIIIINHNHDDIRDLFLWFAEYAQNFINKFRFFRSAYEHERFEVFGFF